MNLRTLKKLSKRAAPLLPLLGDHREQFRAEKHGNYTKTAINARKHWERFSGVHPSNYPPKEVRPGEIYYRARSGRIISISNHHIHPRKGTAMVGAMSCTDEPEWDEETAWDALCEIVWWNFVEIVHDEDGDSWPRPTRNLHTPAEVFAAAAEMVAAEGAKNALRGAAKALRDAASASHTRDGGRVVGEVAA